MECTSHQEALLGATRSVSDMPVSYFWVAKLSKREAQTGEQHS